MILNCIDMEGLGYQNMNIFIGDTGSPCYMTVFLKGMIEMKNIDEYIIIRNVQANNPKNIGKKKGMINLSDVQNQDIILTM